MNRFLKMLFILLLVLNNRFTQNYAILLKSAYFGFAGLLFYYLVSRFETLTINSKDNIPFSILLMNALVLFVAGLYLQINLEVIIYGVFPYIYILLICLLFHNRKCEYNNSVILFVEKLIFFNAVICFFQGIYLLLKMGQWQDLVTGIHPYGTANELGYVFVIGILITNFYENKFSNWKTMLYVITLFLMEAKGAILLLLLAFIIIKFDDLKQIKESIITVLVLLIIGSGMFYLINQQSHSVKFKTDIIKALEYESSYSPTASAARIAHFFFVVNNYFKMYNLSPWFGSGIGSYESPAGYYFNSKYLRLKKKIFLNKGNNTPQVTHTQIATTLAEGGYLGLICFELGLISFLVSFQRAGHIYSLALLSVFFIAQIFHYIFLTFLTFIVFWPVLFTILKMEREKIRNGHSMINYRSDT